MAAAHRRERPETLKNEHGKPICCVGDISKDAEFFSFGTNDLTQMTFGFSRDAAGKICESEPFARLAAAGNSGGFYMEKSRRSVDFGDAWRYNHFGLYV